MKLFLSVWMAFMFTCSFGQVDLAGHFKQLYDASKFDEVIGYTLKDGDSLSAKALYLKGMSYYMKSQDNQAMLFLDMAIEKGPAISDVVFACDSIVLNKISSLASCPCFKKTFLSM